MAYRIPRITTHLRHTHLKGLSPTIPEGRKHFVVLVRILLRLKSTNGSPTKETELSVVLSAEAARRDRRGNVVMASSPPVDKMDVDTEDDATPRPRKREKWSLPT